MQKWNDDLFDAFLCVVDWSTRVNQLHALRFGQRDLQVRITHARVKVGFLDVESIARDLAVMQSAKPLARWYRIAAEAPTPGDRLLTIGYDWRRERDIFATRTFTVQLLRIVARSLIFAPGTERGASGACVFNMRGEVVAINAWGVPSDDGGKGGAAPGVWGETFEEQR